MNSDFSAKRRPASSGTNERGMKQKVGHVPQSGGMRTQMQAAKPATKSPVVNENSVLNKKSKPFYKKAWFWVVIAIFVLIGVTGASSGGSGDKDQVADDKGNSTTTSAEPTCSDEEKVEVVDLSGMDANSIAQWASENGLSYKVGEAAYSDTVASGSMLTQSVEAGARVCPGTELTVSYSLGVEPTMEQRNALAKAESYSELMHMSKAGIYDQLTSEYGEGFSPEAAQYAIDNLQADYKANALEKAKSYQETMHMSRDRIYDQLISEYGEQFTLEEAQYAIDNLPE